MHKQPETWGKDPCPSCGGIGSRVYMKSAVELNRGAELILMLKAGHISRLRFQPRYDLTVNGIKICTYVSDFEYYQDGKLVVEDVKPLRFMDGEAKLKIALFNALNSPHGLTVTIHKKA